MDYRFLFAISFIVFLFSISILSSLGEASYISYIACENIPVYPNNYKVEWYRFNRAVSIYTTDTANVVDWYTDVLESDGWTVEKSEKVHVPADDVRQCGQPPPECWVWSSTFIRGNETFTLGVTCIDDVEFIDESKPGLGVCLRVTKKWITIDCVEKISGSSANVCEIPASEIEARNPLISNIRQTYGIEIIDSNMCTIDDPPWKSEDIKLIEETLSELPSCFLDRLNLTSIGGVLKNRNDPIKKSVDASVKTDCATAFALYNPVTNEIFFCDRQWEKMEDIPPTDVFKQTVVHELTHAFQYYLGDEKPLDKTNVNPIMWEWVEKTGWLRCLPVLGCGGRLRIPSDVPTEYAKTNPFEDMAESARIYYSAPEALERISPARFNFVKEKLFCNAEFG